MRIVRNNYFLLQQMICFLIYRFEAPNLVNEMIEILTLKYANIVNKLIWKYKGLKRRQWK